MARVKGTPNKTDYQRQAEKQLKDLERRLKKVEKLFVKKAAK